MNKSTFSLQPESFFIALLLLFAAALAQANVSQGEPLGTAGFNDLLAQQVKPGTLTTEQQADGSFLLTNKLQTVSAHVTGDKVEFDSIGNSAGKGGFSLSLTQWGRDKHLQKTATSKLYRDGDAVYHSRTNGITEKFSNTTNGIQQDFVIASKPQGKGNLHIELQVGDAGVTPKGTGAVIKLKSGRELTYDRLAVTDSTNKAIPAQIVVKSGNTLDISVDDSKAQYPLTIDPTVGSPSWVAMGSGMNSYGYVRALAIDGNGNVYAGGQFTTAGGVSANRIAKWDGTAWSALGTGMNNVVYAVAVDSHGVVYAGGAFTKTGDGITTLNYIAKWDGTAWSSFGSGMDYGVSALFVDKNDNLYAGGGFTEINGFPATRVAKWDGSAWSALGSGMDNGINVFAVDSSGNLYAGGDFVTAGGVTANYVAKWNGTTWSALGGG